MSGLDETNKSTLAMISGLGFMGMVFFFYFFMTGKEYEDLYVITTIIIILSALTIFFYLLEDLNFMFDFCMKKADPEDYHTKVKKASNFISGLLLMGIAGLNIIAYSEYTDLGKSARLLIITFLTLFSVFLLLYSMFLALED